MIEVRGTAFNLTDCGDGRMQINFALEDPCDLLDYREASGGTIEITDIQVKSEQRKGRGRRLLEALFHLVGDRQVWAITRTSNRVAQHFYEARKFRVTGVLRRFYSEAEEGADAVMYGRNSKGPV